MSIIIQVFSIIIVFLAFKYNEQYIEENFCINQAYSSSCKGQCFLLNNLAGQDVGCQKQKHHGKVLGFLLEHGNDLLSVKPNIDSWYFLTIKFHYLKNDNFHTLQFISQGYLSNLFRPPISNNI